MSTAIAPSPVACELLSSVSGDGFVCSFLPDLMISVAANAMSFGGRESRVYLRVLRKTGPASDAGLQSALFTLLLRRPYPDYQPVIVHIARLAVENADIFRRALIEEREIKRVFAIEVETVDSHGEVRAAYSNGERGFDAAAWSAILGIYADFLACTRSGFEDSFLGLAERSRCRMEARWRGCVFPAKWNRFEAGRLVASLESIGYRDQAALAAFIAESLS